jgi:RHS repeat-associated protein
MDIVQEAPNTVFLAGDEAGLYLQATTCHVWSPTGQTPVVRADPGRAKPNFYGTLNLQTGQEIAMRSDIMNAEVSAQHLELILETNPVVPILLFWDRAPWHRGKPIDKLLEEHPRLEIIFFPTASPDLNPQEQVWKSVRKEVSHNHLEVRLPQLADRFLNKLNSTTFKSSFLDKYGYTNEYTSQGLIYLRSRTYDPASGRFTTKDTWMGNYARPLTLNRWMYVMGNPVDFIDPSGMKIYDPNDMTQDGQIHDVIKFIVRRMQEDSASKDVQNIYQLNTKNFFAYESACTSYNSSSWWWLVAGNYAQKAAEMEISSHLAAQTAFMCLVADARSRPTCGKYDYKVEIASEWGNAQRIDFAPLGKSGNEIFYYDIWANFHYGYVGTKAGFTKFQLLEFATLEQAGSHPGSFADDPSDQTAISVGIQLAESNTLSEISLLSQLYLHRQDLNKARIDENGVITEIYR